MPTLRSDFTYEVVNTSVTDDGEGRIEVDIKSINTSEEPTVIGKFYFGVGIEDPKAADVEALLYGAAPQYFV